MTLLDQIRQTIARYSMVSPGDHLGIAVSGGPDSLCLLYTLFELRPEFDLDLSVVHVDHNLRGAESRADAEFVHNSAQRLGLPFHLRTLDLDLGRGNLEQEARRARQAFFQDLIRSRAVQKIALGHTRSDQAETVLFRLLRGAGSAGFSGIRPVTNLGIIRPLLQVTRPEVEDWLKRRNVEWREDSSNLHLRFDRNRIRHQLLPQLESDWNPSLVEVLAQTADWAFEEEQYWQHEIPKLISDWVRFADGRAVLEITRLNALPVAVVRRVLREVVRRVKYDLLGVGFSHIEEVRRLAARPEGSGRCQIAGVEVVRSFDWLCFAKSGSNYCSQLFVDLDLIPNSGVYNKDVNALDWHKVWESSRKLSDGWLVLRNWLPGDQYQRQGTSAPQKIKRLFQEFRIPVWERRNWPVLCVGGSIAWSDRFGPAAQFAVGKDSRTVLKLRVEARTG